MIRIGMRAMYSLYGLLVMIVGIRSKYSIIFKKMELLLEWKVWQIMSIIKREGLLRLSEGWLVLGIMALLHKLLLSLKIQRKDAWKLKVELQQDYIFQVVYLNNPFRSTLLPLLPINHSQCFHMKPKPRIYSNFNQ